MAELGWSVIDTDVIARELTQPGQEALEEIFNEFGTVVRRSDGSLDRAALAELVFNDGDALKRLETILHPRIRQEWKARAGQLEGEGANGVLVVIPLLFETGAAGAFQKVICVGCTPVTQWSRLRQRGWTDDHISNRLKAQIPLREKMDRADLVVWNEFDLSITEAQVRGLTLN